MLLKARITTLVLFGCFASVAQAQLPAPSSWWKRYSKLRGQVHWS